MYLSCRYVEESMEDEKEDSLGTDDRPPMVNGMAVPIREAPMKSARPGKRQQPMESEEYEVNGITNSVDGLMNVSSIFRVCTGLKSTILVTGLYLSVCDIKDLT